MVSTSLDNIGSDNGLSPDGTNPLPEPTMAKRQWGIVAATGNFTENSRDISSWYEWKNY